MSAFFSVLCLSQLPYTVDSDDNLDELYVFTYDEAVHDLRDQYQADLVVLVGYFPGVCGRGCVECLCYRSFCS